MLQYSSIPLRPQTRTEEMADPMISISSSVFHFVNFCVFFCVDVGVGVGVNVFSWFFNRKNPMMNVNGGQHMLNMNFIINFTNNAKVNGAPNIKL